MPRSFGVGGAFGGPGGAFGAPPYAVEEDPQIIDLPPVLFRVAVWPRLSRRRREGVRCDRSRHNSDRR